MLASKRERNRVEQRQRILDAARLLFADRGFDAVTMAEVADDAGVARATVFNYFASKHALVEAITEEIFAYYAAMLGRALELEDVPTPVLLRACFEHMGGGIEMAHAFYRRAFREVMKVQAGLDEGGPAHRARELGLERVRALMARGQARGDLRAWPDADHLACAFDSLAQGTIVHWLYDDPSGSLPARMRMAAEIFLGPVVAAERDPGPKQPLPDLAPTPFFDPAGPAVDGHGPGTPGGTP
jgi:AcrR family transcriptional regulator